MSEPRKREKLTALLDVQESDALVFRSVSGVRGSTGRAKLGQRQAVLAEMGHAPSRFNEQMSEFDRDAPARQSQLRPPSVPHDWLDGHSCEGI